MFKKIFRFSVKDFLISFLILFIFYLLCFFLRRFDDGNTYPSVLFMLAVLLISRFTDGYFYGIAACFLSVIGINFFFTYPYFKFNFSLEGYPLTVISSLIVAIITSAMTSRVKDREEMRIAAEKEAMRGNLLRAVSHDLRTPLTSISGASALLSENGESLSEEEKHDLYNEINEDSRRLVRIVENLLYITRFKNDSGHVEKAPELVEEIVSYAVNKAKKYYPDLKTEVSIPDEMLFVPMDCMLIEQVIINLIENSALHGANVTKVAVAVKKIAEGAEFSVRDNGKGFEKNVLEKLNREHFADISVHDDSTKNMGIGLSVCSAIIKAHGGNIRFENTDSGGARVSFVLPPEEEEKR